MTVSCRAERLNYNRFCQQTTIWKQSWEEGIIAHRVCRHLFGSGESLRFSAAIKASPCDKNRKRNATKNDEVQFFFECFGYAVGGGGGGGGGRRYREGVFWLLTFSVPRHIFVRRFMNPRLFFFERVITFMMVKTGETQRGSVSHLGDDVTTEIRDNDAVCYCILRSQGLPSQISSNDDKVQCPSKNLHFFLLLEFKTTYC